MVILGIDTGIQANGVAAVEKQNNEFQIKYLKEIKTKASVSLPKRLYFIFSKLEEIIDEFKPQVLVIEKVYSHHRHPTTAASLGSVRGVVMLLGAMKKIEIVEYPVTHVKKAVTAYGTASKEQMKRTVSYLANLKEPLKSQHLADALGLVFAHMHTLRVERTASGWRRKCSKSMLRRTKDEGRRTRHYSSIVLAKRSSIVHRLSTGPAGSSSSE